MLFYNFFMNENKTITKIITLNNILSKNLFTLENHTIFHILLLLINI